MKDRDDPEAVLADLIDGNEYLSTYPLKEEAQADIDEMWPSLKKWWLEEMRLEVKKDDYWPELLTPDTRIQSGIGLTHEQRQYLHDVFGQDLAQLEDEYGEDEGQK